MKILEIYMKNFGKFSDRRIFFHDGINLLYGKNEAGKSTIYAFLRAMLFGIEKARGGLRKAICTTSASLGKIRGILREACGLRAEERFSGWREISTAKKSACP